MLTFRAKHENDRNDAGRQARPCTRARRRTVHVPPPEVRAWRELINCRAEFIAKRNEYVDKYKAS